MRRNRREGEPCCEVMMGERVSTYFTDREYGARPATIDVMNERLWAGLFSLIQTRIGDGSFGLRFPEQCADGNGPCGCDGQARRLLPRAIANTIGWALFQTGDAETDRLLEAARQRFLSPKPEDRQDALEKLWDAFERLKTLEPGANKRVQADALLDRVAPPGSGFREALGREAAELTSIGNSFRIRHCETTQEALTSLDQVDYLFTRMFAFVRVILKGTGRGG